VRYDVPMDLIAEFLRHNTMMNERLLEACRPLTAEQLGTSVAGTYGTVGATLVHIVNSQVGYVPRFLLADKPPRLPEDPFPGFDALTSVWASATGFSRTLPHGPARVTRSG
jgi:uncharacterized damage-inducible protein DinB